MNKTFWQKYTRGFVFLLAGVGLLFIGAAGAFNLFEKTASPEFLGEEVPREMIEAGYASGEEEDEPGEDDQGFVPLFAPVDSGAVITLPTLEAASGQDLNEEKAFAPTAPPQDIDKPENPYPTSLPEEEKAGAVPLWIYIDEIALEAPILSAVSTTVEVEDDGEVREFVQWEAPDEFSVGWHTSSARLGQVGNTVLNGHHNAYGRVFRNLAYLQEGDYIQVYGDDGAWYTYIVANKMVLPEWNVPLETRIQNAAWTLPSEDERLTLITCWPEQSNSHRLIIVARPVHW